MPTLTAQDHQVTWAPAWLLNLQAAAWDVFDPAAFDVFDPPTAIATFDGAGAASGRLASRDLDVSGTPWYARIVGEPSVSRAMTETIWGVVEVGSAQVALTNADGVLDALWDVDLRGYPVTLSRYDEVSATTIVELTGRVTQVSREDGIVTLTITGQDGSALQREIPWRTVDTTTFPKAVDTGAAIPICFGNPPLVKLPYVNDDTTTNVYDYLVGEGAITVAAVYRAQPDGSLHAVGVGEYTVETTRYSGLTTLRFTARQINFSGSFYTLWADVTGLAAESNPATAISTLLSDTTYGLGESVNATSFSDAATAITSVGGLQCDMALTSPRQAQDVLHDLLAVRGLRLGINASGEWTVTVDTLPSTIQMLAEDGVGDGEKTIIRAGQMQRPPLDAAVSTLVLRYGWDALANTFRYEQSRTVHSGFGQRRVLENRAIQDHTTADKTVDYLAKRELAGEQAVDLLLSQEARQVFEGHLIRVTYAPLGLSSQTMEVRQTEKALDGVRVLLGGWSSGVYDYTSGVLPSTMTVPTPSGPPVLSTDLLAAIYTVAAPSAITARQAGGKLVQVDVTQTDPVNWGWDEFYRSCSTCSDDFVLKTKIKSHRWPDEAVEYGETWYYAAKMADNEGHLSSFSPFTTGTLVLQILSSDIQTSGVQTGNIMSAGVTGADLATLSSQVDLVAGATTIVLSLAFSVVSTGTVLLWGDVQSTASVSTGSQYRIVRAMAATSSGTSLDYVANFGGGNTATVLRAKDSPGVGAFYYRLDGELAGGEAATALAGHLTVLEAKR